MKKHFAATLALLMTPLAAAADEQSYYNLEAGVALGDLVLPALEGEPGHDVSPLGVHAQGPVEVGDSLYLVGDVQRGHARRVLMLTY